MPAAQTERPTMLERFNEYSVIRWMRGRTAPSKNGHSQAQGSVPRAAHLLKTDAEAKNIADIVEQMRPDYQVAFCERILQANVQSVRVTIAAEGDDPTATALATKLQELWDQSLSGMADDVAYGRVAHEKVWEVDTQGLFHYIRKLEPLPFRETRMKLEEDGSFGGIELKTKNNDWILIPPAEAWWQALDATAKQPHGQSRFLPAPYEVWKEKKGAKKNRKTAQSKWAVRGPIYRGPIVDFDEQTGQQFDVMKEMEPALQIHSEGGALMLSNAAHPTMGEQGKYAYEIEDNELKGFDPNALNTSMERLDVEMCRAFGIPEQTIIEAGAVGTYGSIAQKMLILFATVESILYPRVQSFQQYVIEPTKEINGVPESVKITATFVPLTKRPDAFVFEVIKVLLANPSFVEAILSGGVDLREILEQAGLPVTENLEQVLLAVAQRMAAAAGGGAPGQPGQPGAALGGEYASTGRRQWQNNVKAIRDVLGDLIAGNTSETMALELLQSLGLTPERAAVLIGDAKDNARIDDPELALSDAIELCGGEGGTPGPCPTGRKERPKSQKVKLPKDPRKVSIQQAGRALDRMGYKLKGGKYDIKTRKAKYHVVLPDGSSSVMDTDTIKSLIYGGAGRSLSDAMLDDPELQVGLSDSLRFDDLRYTLSWSSGSHPRDKNGKFVSTANLDIASRNVNRAVEVRGLIGDKDLPGFDKEMTRIHGESYTKSVSKSPSTPKPSPGGSSSPPQGSGGSEKLSKIKPSTIKDSAGQSFVEEWTGEGGGEAEYQAAKSAGAKWANGEKNPAIDAVYADTQAKLKAAGVSKVPAYRGVQLPDDHPLVKDIRSGKIKPGDDIEIDGTSFVGWSTDADVAGNYAKSSQASTKGKGGGKKFGIVLEREIPAEDIVSGSQFHRGFVESEQEILARHSGGAYKLRLKAVH